MHLISYDIQHDGLRTKIAKMLIRYGCYRVQYSVFMGALAPKSIKAIKIAIEHFSIHEFWTPGDAVLLLPLHQYSEDNLQFFGKTPELWDEISGKIRTLVL